MLLRSTGSGCFPLREKGAGILKLSVTPAAAPAGEVLLTGLWLRVFQVIWSLLVLCDLTVLLVSLPLFYGVLHTLRGDCATPNATCQADQLTPQAAAALQQLGISLHAYAFAVFIWDLVISLAFLFIGAVIIWRKATTTQSKVELTGGVAS